MGQKKNDFIFFYSSIFTELQKNSVHLDCSEEWLAVQLCPAVDLSLGMCVSWNQLTSMHCTCMHFTQWWQQLVPLKWKAANITWITVGRRNGPVPMISGIFPPCSSFCQLIFMQNFIMVVLLSAQTLIENYTRVLISGFTDREVSPPARHSKTTALRFKVRRW